MATKDSKFSAAAVRETGERDLTAAAQQGDRRALEELIRRHEGQVLRFGQRMCGNPHDAEEVLQDTFLAMTRYLGDYEGKSALSTWLYAIARSYCIKKRRRSKFAPSHIESLSDDRSRASSVVADPARRPDEEVAGAQMQALLDHAIGGLKPMYRDVLVLRDVEGLTAPEVSEVLGLSIQAIKSRLHRAREQVRGELEPVLNRQMASMEGKQCQHTAILFSKHIEGDIDASTCAKMEQHVAECPHCGEVCSGLRQMLAVCRRAGSESPEVPEEIQRAVRNAIKSYLDAMK